MEAKKKIVVTGSHGQLGSELKELAALYNEYEFHFLTRNELPLTNLVRIDKVLRELHPDFLINCAAYTAVDKAESEKEEALLVNGKAVAQLAETCAGLGTKFLHISTDYVFDGTSKEPLKESDAVNPVNYYGASKLAGEKAALEKNPETLIIRTSWVFSAYGKNFVKTMMRLMNEKQSINVVSDQWGSPTYAADLAHAILHIIASGNWQPGVYHYSNDGMINWWQFATEIASLTGSSCTINPILTADYPTPAKRPLYSVMDKTKIQAAYHVPIKNWKQSLRECLQKLSEHKIPV